MPTEIEVRAVEEAHFRFLQALQIPLIAVSLGGVESLICVPAQGTHACMSPEDRKVRFCIKASFLICPRLLLICHFPALSDPFWKSTLI